MPEFENHLENQVKGGGIPVENVLGEMHDFCTRGFHPGREKREEFFREPEVALKKI